jgi:hypothetical protein
LFYGPQLAATSRLPFGPQQEAAEVESKVVLIVDDSEDNRFLYQTILTYPGYTVLEARQGCGRGGAGAGVPPEPGADGHPYAGAGRMGDLE